MLRLKEIDCWIIEKHSCIWNNLTITVVYDLTAKSRFMDVNRSLEYASSIKVTKVFKTVVLGFQYVRNKLKNFFNGIERHATIQKFLSCSSIPMYMNKVRTIG